MELELTTSSMGHRVFNLLGPVVPRSELPRLCGAAAVTSWGSGDEEKRVCEARLVDASSPCVILSLGCHGRWLFERYAVNRTRCAVHTFDCTGTWRVPSPLRHRVTLHKLCVGPAMAPSSRKSQGPSGSSDARRFIGYEDVLRRTGRRAPSLMKMDVNAPGYQKALVPPSCLATGHRSPTGS